MSDGSALALYSKSDVERVAVPYVPPEFSQDPEPYRSEFRRDYARLIHSPAFRRLTGKTQLYPGLESDFFRNRLTHSLEVAQIAKSLSNRLNHLLPSVDGGKEIGLLDSDLIEFAALAHDIGHPPFGHTGEAELDHIMRLDGGFEGNAQTLRILCRLEKRELPYKEKGFEDDDNHTPIDKRVGLNLTYRSLAAVLKYDSRIPPSKGKGAGLSKGYYASETALVKSIKAHVTGDANYQGPFKTVECQIMDIADDIAYSAFDLEDSLKARFISPMDMISLSTELYSEITDRVNHAIRKRNEQYPKEVHLDEIKAGEVSNTIAKILVELLEPRQFDFIPNMDDAKGMAYFSIMNAEYVARMSRRVVSDGYDRSDFLSRLVGRFVRSVKWHEINKAIPALSKIFVEGETFKVIEILKQMNYVRMIKSPRLRIVEFRGREIVRTIFQTLRKGGYDLLPDDYRDMFKKCKNHPQLEMRTICDFVSGMTDRYAVEFYARLKSEDPATIFKPF